MDVYWIVLIVPAGGHELICLLVFRRIIHLNSSFWAPRECCEEALVVCPSRSAAAPTAPAPAARAEVGGGGARDEGQGHDQGALGDVGGVHSG